MWWEGSEQGAGKKKITGVANRQAKTRVCRFRKRGKQEYVRKVNVVKQKDARWAANPNKQKLF